MLTTHLMFLLVGQGGAPVGRDPMASWPMDRIFAVLIVSCFFLWCLVSPNVRRSVTNIFAVLAFGAGIGILTWLSCSVALGEQIRSLASLPTLVSTLIDAIGLAAAALAAGSVALLFSLGVRTRWFGEEIPHSAGVGIPQNHR